MTRDEIVQVGWLTGGENFVRKIYLYCMCSSIFGQ